MVKWKWFGGIQQLAIFILFSSDNVISFLYLSSKV